MNNEDKILSMLEQQGAVLEKHSVLLEQQGAVLEKHSALLEKHSALLETLVTKVDRLEQGQAKLEQGQAKLEQEVAEVKERVILMENEDKRLFGGLYDAYQQLYDVSGDIRAGMNKLTARQEKQDLQIIRLNAERRLG